MKPTINTPPTLLNVLTQKDNSIGNKINKKSKAVAVFSLSDLKAKEHQKLSEGYIWLTQGKTSKLCHPNKVNQYLSEGWLKAKH